MDQIISSTEVRTHRLVITDDQDQPRMVVEVVEGVMELRVATKDPQTHVLLYAGPTAASGTDGLGVELFVGGDSVARMHAWSDGDRWHWKVTAEEE